MSEPLLSVCLITYNHAKYIRQAIDGVLMQKVNFSWELIIADDFSTDGTKEILQDYKNKYPDFIKLILQEKNVGAAKNWMDLITAPNSKYIAYFEGDDYWTDPLKLQKQVDFLEANEEFVICGHDRRRIDNNNDILVDSEFNVLKNKELLTQCVVFKNVGFDDLFLSFLNKVSNGDTFLFLYIQQFGKTKLLDFNGADYRIGESGVWSTKNKKDRYESALFSYSIMQEYFKLIKNKRILKVVFTYSAFLELNYGSALIESGRYKAALFQLFKFNRILFKGYVLELLKLRYLKINMAYIMNILNNKIRK